MKTILLSSVFLFLNLSCTRNEKRIFIKSEQKDHTSFDLTDFSIKGDTLKIQLLSNKYKIDSTSLLNSGFKITIDTTGKIWNEAPSRLGRLQSKEVDYSMPYFVDSYCGGHNCD